MKVPWKKTYTKRCKDGSEWIVHRNIADAFPFWVPGIDMSAAVEAGALPGAPPVANVKAEYRSTVDAILFGIDELNQSLMFKFRFIYAAYESNPCRNGESFTRQVEQLVLRADGQTEWRMKARAYIALASSDSAKSDQVATLFSELIGGIGGPGVRLAAAEEIGLAKEDAQKMLEAPTQTHGVREEAGLSAQGPESESEERQ